MISKIFNLRLMGGLIITCLVSIPILFGCISGHYSNKYDKSYASGLIEAEKLYRNRIDELNVCLSIEQCPEYFSCSSFQAPGSDTGYCVPVVSEIKWDLLANKFDFIFKIVTVICSLGILLLLFMRLIRL